MRLAIIEIASQGGLLHYAVQLGDALARRGHAVDLIVPKDNELTSISGPARRRPVLEPPMRPGAPPAVGLRYQLRRIGVGARLGRAWARIIWEVQFGRYDAVVLNADIGLSLSAAATLLLTGLPRRPSVAFVCHSVRPLNRWGGAEMFSSPPLLLALLKRAFPSFDLVFVHGEHSRTDYLAMWPATRLAVIPHGDERLFGDDPPAPAAEERILFFGDWRRFKGLDVLMRAFDTLVERRPSVRLTIAGTPLPADLDPEIVRAWARGHGARVEIIDHYVPIHDVPRVFGRARVVTTPYLYAYQSGVLHLAMTMSRAVVASDVGDLSSRVVDEVTGRLVPPGDPDALAAALEGVVADPSVAQRMGEAGHELLMRRSSWEAVAKRCEEELTTLRDER